jgi:hypothetical protein
LIEKYEVLDPVYITSASCVASTLSLFVNFVSASSLQDRIKGTGKLIYQSHTTQFDCLRLNAELVSDQSYDDLIFLLSIYDHLEQQCDDETDRLEALADSINQRAEASDFLRAEELTRKTGGAATERPFCALEHPEGANNYMLPHQIIETVQAFHGEKDSDLLLLEAAALRIENYLAQLAELEVEIATAMPATSEGVMLKLKFLSGLSKDGSGFASDILAYVVEQSVEHLSTMLDISLANGKT